MNASRFEFEKRFWIICAIYFAGFCLSVFDHTPFIVAIRHLIAPTLVPGSAEAERFARIVILLGSLLVFLAAALRTWGAAYLRTEIVHDTSSIPKRWWPKGLFVTRGIRFISPPSQWRPESAFWQADQDLFSWCWRTGFLLTG
jgi:hypothetical protein